MLTILFYLTKQYIAYFTFFLNIMFLNIKEYIKCINLMKYTPKGPSLMPETLPLNQIFLIYFLFFNSNLIKIQ